MCYFFRIKTCFITIIVLNLLSPLSVNAESKLARTKIELPDNISLYNFFQNECFSSIEDITLEKENQAANTKNKSKQALLNSLYLSYGLKDRAHKTFKNITLKEIQEDSQDILGQDWFNIGKDYYIDGFGEELKNTLLVIDNGQQSTLDSAYESKQLNVLSKICMQNQQYGDVLEMLELFPDGSMWKQYAKLNLGVNLIKNDRLAEAVPLLEEVSELSESNDEYDVLSDQANLVLAASYTKLNKLALAVEYFEKIKLGNPQSNSALLGLGWVKFKMASYNDALRVWLVLSKRSRSDAYVHEALMLIPYVLEKRANKVEALTQYEFAIEAFAQQLKNVEEIKSRLKQGEMARILRSGVASEVNYDLRSAIRIMGAELSDGLYELMTSSDFIQVVKNHRQLAKLSDNLLKWSQIMPSLTAMPDEKMNAYNYRLAAVVNRLKFEYARKLRDRQAGLVEQLDKKKSNLAEIKNDDERIYKLKEKYRFLSGLLKWNVNIEEGPRVQVINKNPGYKKIASREAHNPMKELPFSWGGASVEHKNFTRALKEKKQRINTLRIKLEKLMSVQEEKAQLMAEKFIDQYREYVKKYHDRALFSKARLYDSMVSRN